MFAKLSRTVNQINAAIVSATASGDLTTELSGVLEIRENEDGKFLGDPVSDFKTSISDRADVSILHIFTGEISFGPPGGRGDGNRYPRTVKMALVCYAAREAGDLYSFIEGLLAGSGDVTLTGATFNPTEINSSFLFLEESVNYDRRLFAITYDLLAGSAAPGPIGGVIC